MFLNNVYFKNHSNITLTPFRHVSSSTWREHMNHSYTQMFDSQIRCNTLRGPTERSYCWTNMCEDTFMCNNYLSSYKYIKKPSRPTEWNIMLKIVNWFYLIVWLLWPIRRKLENVLNFGAKSLRENNAIMKYIYIHTQNYIRRYIQWLSMMSD